MKNWIDKETYYKYEKETAKLRMGGGSWTIKPEKLLESIKTIVYITPNKRYTINKEDAFKHGWILSFKGENKLVVPLKYWN